MDKGCEKGPKKGAENRNVHSSLLFGPFSLPFFSDFIQYRILDLDFLDLHPFLHVEIEKAEKTPRKTEGIQKRERKREEKKATVNDLNILRQFGLNERQRRETCCATISGNHCCISISLRRMIHLRMQRAVATNLGAASVSVRYNRT
jgi:hypothetical protein